MKKWTFLFLGLLLIGSGASALDMALGAGGMVNGSETYGGFTVDGSKYDLNVTRAGGGGFVFFGFSQYAELNLGFLYKMGDLEVTGYEGVAPLDNTIAVQFGLYGKYPIPFSDRFVFFPTVGVDFEFTTETAEGAETVSGWWHDLWLRGGVGLDFFLSERFFIRGHVIYGAALPVSGPEEFGLELSHGYLFKLGLGFML